MLESDFLVVVSKIKKSFCNFVADRFIYTVISLIVHSIRTIRLILNKESREKICRKIMNLFVSSEF